LSPVLTLKASDCTGLAKLHRRDSGKHPGQMRNVKSKAATLWTIPFQAYRFA
jgi:hypothetical protein